MSHARPQDAPAITESELELAAKNAFGDWVWAEVVQHAAIQGTSLILPTQSQHKEMAESTAKVLGVGPQARHRISVGDTIKFLMYAEPPEVQRDRERVRKHGGQRRLVPRAAEEFQVVRRGDVARRIVVVPLQNIELSVSEG